MTLVLHGDFAAFSNKTTGKVAVGEWFGDWFRQSVRIYRVDGEDGGQLLAERTARV